jgi:predicted RNase H-like HicB family nuclease
MEPGPVAERGTDGRWIAEVSALSGVLVCGASQVEAMAKAEVLAPRALVLAKCIEFAEAGAQSVHMVQDVVIAPSKSKSARFIGSGFDIARAGQWPG